MTHHPVALVPNALFDDAESEAKWRARYTATKIGYFVSADDAPNRMLYFSTGNGTLEVYVWDKTTDTHRQVTNRPNGTAFATISPDGKTISWFNDTDGDKFGVWVTEPFTSDGSQPVPAIPGVPAANIMSIELGYQISVIATSSDDGSTIYLSRSGDNAKVIYHNKNSATVAALLKDETLMVIRHSEHNNWVHPAIRVISTTDGSVAGDLWDGPEKGVRAIGFAPVAGDNRLLVTHERMVKSSYSSGI